MRLRLVVRRHNLPDAAVVWAVEQNENPTISQLLEQINEVIPLESGGDWGLEDYVVEIKGSGVSYECLHFYLVRTILHDDDEVLIRPLLSNDLKLRKLSGRHQISSDGKHLFDGWVFGRPRPRGLTDRPSVEIPPRKRRRITFDEDTDSSLDENPLEIEGRAHFASDSDGNHQLLLSADFEDDDDDDDENFEPDEEDDDDEDDDGDGNNDDEDVATLNGIQKECHKQGDATNEEEILAQAKNPGQTSEVQQIHEAFPQAPLSVCENILISCQKDVSKAWDVLSQAFKPSRPRKSMNKRTQNKKPSRATKTRPETRASSNNDNLSVFEHDEPLEMDNDLSEPPPGDEDNSLLQYYDRHGLPEGSISTGNALSHMANIVSSSREEKSHEQSEQKSAGRAPNFVNKGNGSVRFAEGSSRVKSSVLAAHSDSNDSKNGGVRVQKRIIESDDSSSDSSDVSSDTNNGESENDDESTSSEGSDSATSSSTSDSDSGSESDSDQEPEEISSRLVDQKETVVPEIAPPGMSPLKEASIHQKEAAPPGHGKNSTRLRNQRRRTTNLLKRYRDKGILPAGTTVKEMERLGLEKARASGHFCETFGEAGTEDFQIAKRLAENTTTRAAEFEFRRQQLLDSLASGGIEVGGQSASGMLTTAPQDSVPNQADEPQMVPVPEAAVLETPLTPSVDKVTQDLEASGARYDVASLTPAMAKTPVEPVQSTASESTLRPRWKVDLGAAGRLVFGHLGVRAPKNEADHEKVRQDLLRDIRPSKTAPAAEMTRNQNDSFYADEDPEAWRKVINLRAVECCHDSIEYSPAPFPFIQRWDPQQQGAYSRQGNRGGKAKRSLRNQPQYYNDEQQTSKKRKRNQNSHDNYFDMNDQCPAADDAAIEDGSCRDEAIQTVSTDTSGTQIVYSDGTEGAVNDQIMKDVQEAATSQTAYEDDLPKLPDDVSILPNFIDDEVKPGMVIAFKQLILSEATHWQPEISNYRTAVIIRASENGNLEVRLAKRDRKQTGKCFNVETGERIYGKFEMPIGDDQNDEEDDGFLEFAMNEIVEPKIVQLAPDSFDTEASSPLAVHNKLNINTDDSKTPGHAESMELSQSYAEAPQEANDVATNPQDLHDGDTNLMSIRGGDFSAGHADDKLPLSFSEDMRDEISILIKAAGFRTSVPSSVLKAQTQLLATPRSDSQKGSYSPRFNGFESSPESSPSQSIQAISSPYHFNPTTPFTEDVCDTVDSYDGAPENKAPAPNVQYPKLSLPSPLGSQVSDRGRQPDYTIPVDDSLHRFDDLESFLGDQEELPLKRDGDLPPAQLIIGSQDSSSKRVISSPPNPPSSGGLPTFAEMFSTARSSVGPKPETPPLLSQKTDVKDGKKIEDSYNRTMEALDAMFEEEEDAEPIIPKLSRGHSKREPTAPTTSQKESASQFIIPPGSQQVDLTLSSDVEPGAGKENVTDDSYDDDYDLPHGPGWVEKKTRRTRRQTTGNSQASLRRVTGTRTTRRKTMTKF